MKRFLTVLLAGLLIVAVTAPAIAWEFNMKGEYEYRFRYLGRTGNHDLFGIDLPQNGAVNPAALVPALPSYEVGFAGPNIYGKPFATAIAAPAATAAGERIIAGGYSEFGSDALYYDSRMTLYPEIRVNPAIRVHGVYTVGGIRNKYTQPAAFVAAPGSAGVGVPPIERYYSSQESDNAYDTAAIGSWEQFRATIQIPWGIWSIGVKDFPFGIGSTTANNYRSEAFLTVVPYGPFRFMHGIWLARNAIQGNWGMRPDSGVKPSFFQGMLMTYQTADIDLGMGTIQQIFHGKAAYDTLYAAGFGRAGFDQNLNFWQFYGKYNNGRFFFNGEYTFVQLDQYTAAVGAFYPNAGASILAALPKNTELYHWFAEMGVMAGPSRVTLMAAAASGPVANNENPTKIYGGFPVNYQAMEPYEWLMFNTYGGGNDAFSGPLMPADGHGMMSDAFCYAARLDYAVASNLNVWGSYIWAHRLEKQGSLFGQKLATGAAATDLQMQTFATNAGRGTVTVPVAGTGGAVTRTFGGYVSDGFLGWEANAGVDWKLLEGMTAFFRYAYWQPGDWFKGAYQTRGFVGGAASSAAQAQTFDAINAFSGSLMINF